MIKENSDNSQNPRPPDHPFDLTSFDDAKSLVDEIIGCQSSDPFLKIMALLREALLKGSALDLDMAITNLTVAAFSRSDAYLDMARNYASSLFSQLHESEKPAGEDKLTRWAETLAEIIEDEETPEELRHSISDALETVILKGDNIANHVRRNFAPLLKALVDERKEARHEDSKK